MAVAVLIVVSLVTVCVWAKEQATTSTSPQCSLTGQGQFSAGWTQTVKGYYYGKDDHYRCLPILDANLKEIGAAWVKVEADGTIGAQLPK